MSQLKVTMDRASVLRVRDQLRAKWQGQYPGGQLQVLLSAMDEFLREERDHKVVLKETAPAETVTYSPNAGITITNPNGVGAQVLGRSPR